MTRQQQYFDNWDKDSKKDFNTTAKRTSPFNQGTKKKVVANQYDNQWSFVIF